MNSLIKGTTISVLAIAILQGCAVQKELVPTGGSRADGTVKMSFESGLFEKPQIDTQKAINTAKQRCAAWGYSGAEAFGGASKKCTNNDCSRWIITYEFQCTGTPPASR